MERDILRESLQKNKEFNPFNKDYNIEKLYDLINEHNCENVYSLSIASSTKLFNQYYNEYIGKIKEKFERLNYNKMIICELLMSICNLGAFRALNELYSKAQNGEGLEIEKIVKYESDTKSRNGDSLTLMQQLEGQVDVCNTIYNIIKHYNFERKNILWDKNELKYIDDLHCLGNMLYVLQESYDTALWEEGYIQNKEDGTNSIIVKFINNNYPIIRRIGENEEMQNSANELFDLMEKSKGLINSEEKDNKLKKYILKSVEQNKGYLNYILEEGDSFERNMLLLSSKYTIKLYYPYFEKENFELWGNIGIKDMIVIFCRISDLCYKVFEDYRKYGVKKVESFNLKITRQNLIHYLKSVTSYNKKQIEAALNLFSFSIEDNDRIDLWKKPLLKNNNEFLLLYSSISAPKIEILMDYWLEQAGYNMNKRGKAFERYIKEDISNILQKKEVVNYIPNQSKFYNKQNKYEEIDIFINLKDISILGEIKCIKYPINPRSYHNSLKIIEKAANQVIRKIEFIKKDRNYLSKYTKDLDGKEIIGVVITNLTLFSGIDIEGIPVIDYNLFKSYFESTEEYYNSESEMCSNIGSFLRDLHQIKDKIKNYHLKSTAITSKQAKEIIYRDFVV